MVPASLKRRNAAPPKRPRPVPRQPGFGLVPQQQSAPAAAAAPRPAPASVDDKYRDFMASMQELGAVEGTE